MNKARLLLLLALFGLIGLLMFLTSHARAWQTSISDCQGCGSRAEAVVVDAAGDVIAVGDFFDGSDMVKLSGATGQVKWRSEVMGHESRNHAQDIAIDSHGDVFVVFTYTRLVVKVSGTDGTQIWRKPIGGTLNALLPIISAVAIDRDDNVITAGTMGGFFNVCKLDGQNGDEKWHYDVRGGYAKGVAVDGNGDVAAAGMMNNNFATVKLSGTDGQEIWYEEINGEGIFTDVFEEARAVTIGTDGSVVVAGVTVGVTGEFSDCTKDFTVAKYFPNGDHWIRTINGSLLGRDDRGKIHNGATDEANAVTIDSHGDVIAVGSYQVSPEIGVSAPEHFQVFKLASINGQTLWSSAAVETPPSEIHAFGRAFAVSVDATNDVAVTGVHDGRFTVVKFFGATRVGAEEQRAWPRPFALDTRSLGNGNNAVAVLMDADKNVVAAGENVGSDGWSKFTVVKLRGTDGTDYFALPSPTPTPTPDPAPDFEGALIRYKPILKFDSGEKYFPLSVESITDNSGNKLQRRVIAGSFAILAKSRPAGRWPLLNIDFLGEKYPTGMTASGEDFIDERNNYVADVNRIQSDLRYADRIYGRIYYGLNERGKKVAWLQYWFFYYYNDYRYKTLTGERRPDQHEGDWEMIQVALDSNAHPLSAVYAQHDYASQCVWNEIEKVYTDGQERPVVYVARGSHASYFHAGVHRIKLKKFFDITFDYANGQVIRTDQELKIIVDVTPNEPSPNKKLFSPNWVNWRGHWGGTTKPTGIRPPLPFDADSPPGPKFQGNKWDNPPTFASSIAFDCK